MMPSSDKGDGSTSPLMWTADRPPNVFVQGQGSWLTDKEGKRYLDFVQGWAVNCLGHSHPAMVKAISVQAGKLINSSPAYFTDRLLELAQKIVDHSAMDKVFFTNSGAEANEGAIKLARKWGQVHRSGAHEIVTMHNSFHGRTLATMSASGKPKWESLFEPKVPSFVKVPLNDIEAVRNAITERTVAVMLEPIQGEAGVIPASREYLLALRDLTDREGILLILDEIQTGMGRTGTLFAYEQTGIEPDIMTLGKGIGGGFPLGALTARESVCCFEKGDQGGTFNGNVLAMAAGLAVFEIVSSREFLEGVRRKGEYLRTRLEELSSRSGQDRVRGQGLLLAMGLGSEGGARIVEEAFARGLLLNSPRPDTLRFMPALTVSEKEIDRMIGILEEILIRKQSS
ncbi:MAG: acetylornithine transaminase [Sulfobacillus sp.]